MNHWNTLPESYQQRMYKNTVAAVNRPIQQAENPTPDIFISVDVACVDTANLFDSWTFKVELGKPEIPYGDPYILIDNNCMDEKLHFLMTGGSRD